MTQLSLGQMDLPEFSEVVEFEGSNYAYNYELGILKQSNDEKWNIINENTYHNLFVYEDKLITGNADDGYFELDTSTIVLSEFDTTSLLRELQNFKPNEVFLEKISAGCFHYSMISYQYDLSGVNFNLVPSNNSIENFIPKKLFLNQVLHITKMTVQNINHQLTFKEFGITKKELSNFMKEFDCIEDDFEIMFSKYYDRFQFNKENRCEVYSNVKSLSSDINNLNSKEMNDIFINPKFFTISTSSITDVLRLKNKNGVEISISNSDWETSLGKITWLIEYKGFLFKSNSIALRDEIDQLSDGQLIDTAYLSKEEQLLRIIKSLYHNKYQEYPFKF
ncbi:hypothetical protein [Nonlabens ulvanivorans]|uniref:hypothetical protein n=1 Tax=Nonlabens ulvanivorans TaxID=906888 RepID=UPI0029426F2C|nr:hypothetical protein [Nonlabens ulvanivorans]WOI22102.1 hypothetical protein R1T42_10530 [Nonlabens ulvanivorans]